VKRHYPDAPVVSVGVLVVHRGRILLAQRGHEPAEGLWTFPGGVVELGETLEEAAAREVSEECGVRVRVGKPLTTVDRIFRDEEGRVEYHYVIVEMLAEFLGGEPKPASDIRQVGWFSADEMADVPMTPGTRAIARQVFNEADALDPRFETGYNGDTKGR